MVPGSYVCTRGRVIIIIIIIIIIFIEGAQLAKAVFSGPHSSSGALFSVVVTWSTDSPTQYMVVSSAYRNVVAVLTANGRSLVYKAKSMGPSTEPCGIPCTT